jgi:hypothetical protein
MRRNAVVQDPAGESFAGLLEHLTRRTQPEASEPGFAPWTSSAVVPNPISGSILGSATHSLLPAAEVKTGRGAAMQEGTPLSHEKALRLHARRRPRTNGNLDLPAAQPPSVPSQPGAVPSTRRQTTARKPAQPSETLDRIEGVANSASGKSAILKTPAKAASRARQPATQAGGRPGAKFVTGRRLSPGPKLCPANPLPPGSTLQIHQLPLMPPRPHSAPANVLRRPSPGLDASSSFPPVRRLL